VLANPATPGPPPTPQLDAPVVSKAFLNHDLPTLKQHCGPELIERFSGIFKHFAEAVSGVWHGREGVAAAQLLVG